MPFRTGAVASERDSKTFSSDRLQFLTFKENDDMVVVRFLDEHTAWPVVDVHIGIPTKPIPKNRKDAGQTKWPDKMGATCRNDQGFRILDSDLQPTDEWEAGFGDCYIHSHYADKANSWGKPLSVPVTTTMARVVVREKPEGQPIRDKMEEWTAADGTKHLIPMIRCVSQQWGKFFAAIAAGAFEDESVRTKDYTIKKNGKDFAISSLSITPGHHPGTESWKRYEDACELIKADLEALIRHQASDEWYHLWFMQGPWDEEPLEPEASGAGTQVADGGSTNPDGDLDEEGQRQMAELRERLSKQRAERAGASS